MPEMHSKLATISGKWEETMTFNSDQDSFKALKKVIAERTSTTIAWVGAGLSAQAGLPSWPVLIAHLVEVGRRKVSGMGSPDKEKGLLQALEEKARARDFWVAFHIAEELLGQVTYQAEIREKLDTSAKPPEAYAKLWSTGIQGIISFNLDHFAQQSFSLYKPGARVDTFIGEQARNLAGILQRTNNFIGNPHGDINNSATWIFTQSKLNSLLTDAGYRQFINTCLVSRTVIFIGITVDDKAIEDHLATLREISTSGVTHYWITHRADSATDKWAESLNVRIIRYEAKGSDHSELLECLEALSGAVPNIEPKILRPVISTTAHPTGSILPPDEMLALPLETIRDQLNSHALNLLANANAIAYENYANFEREYDEVIDRAWYATERPPKNKILGYTLIERVAQGSFGDVYSATDPNGSKVALKLLRRDVRREPAMLQTFRRGVRSMQILQKHQVTGMVNFIDASEIPAFVVMDWINGPNLMDAVKAKELTSWDNILNAALQLSEIIYSAHQLPEGVLHRDIRPPNIMLRDLWETREINIVVMDFDLSWHVDALEKSIVAKPLGFMAPEQLHQKKSLTRSALVDSFGFGMTLYYILTEDIPVPDQQKHHDWEKTLRFKIQRRQCPEWKSLPSRVMRLIQGCTLDRQSERPDFSHITSELKSLRQCLLEQTETVSADYYCEEIAANAGTMENYVWNTDDNMAIYKSGGLLVSLAANVPQDELNLTMKWQQTGEENWKALPKTSHQVSERAKPILERGGWSNAKFGASLGQMQIEATLAIDRHSFEPRKLAKAIDSVVAAMLPKG